MKEMGQFCQDRNDELCAGIGRNNTEDSEVGKKRAWCVMSDDQKKRKRYDQLSVKARRQDQEIERVQAWSAAARQREKLLVEHWSSAL